MKQTLPTTTFLCSIVLYGCLTPATSSQADLDTNLFQNTLPSFQTKFHSFVSDALQNDTITDLFLRNIHRGSGKRRVGVGPDPTRTEMSTQALKDLLTKYKVKVDKRYSDALQALRSLKEEFEKSVQQQQSAAGPPSARRLQECCEYRRNIPEPARRSPGYRYEGRYQDEVNVSVACVGKTVDTAPSPFSIKVEDAFHVMKSNYKQVSSVLWQYVATLDGHYVQFPTKNRSCDDSGHSTSPLHQRWVVDKLLQEKLNLVLLLDAGEKMNSFFSSGRPSLPGGPPPVTHLTMAKHAARTVVSQLAFVDRVSVVVMNGSSTTPPGCSDRLMVATDRNRQQLSELIDSVKAAEGVKPGLRSAFQSAYRLLQGEKRTKQNRKDTNDVILVLTNGEYVMLEEEQLLATIKDGQDSLDHNVTHLVYVIKAGDLILALDPLAKVADLNNLKLDNATQWAGEDQPIGPVGLLQTVPESARFGYADVVGDFYRFFPRGAVGGMDRVSAVSPHVDPHVGLLLTYAVPIYNGSKDLSSLYGIAAIDVSMASIFEDVIHFRWRRKSYSFVVERERGMVLVHPKLDNPARVAHTDPVFSSMQFVEPTFTPEQRAAILAASDDGEVKVFDAEIVPGRTTYRTGLDIAQVDRGQAKVVYSLLPDSDYILVLVIFGDELSPQSDTPADASTSLGLKGMALYHHQLVINHTAHDGICASSGDIRTKNKLTVKFSPEVFTEPEVYINSQETAEEVANMADFLTQDSPPPPVIRPEALSSVLKDLRVVSSLSLSRLWIDSFTDGVVERFIGTPSGVFAAYPGISLPNAFDGKQYAWYRESQARPGTVWVSLHRSLTTPDRRVLVSTTLGNTQGLFGVVAVAVSRRSFAGLFLNTVEKCLEPEYSCHLMTTDGHVLDVLDQTTPPGARRHLTALYPWLANVLISRRVMKPVWCTTLSGGRHNLTYVLHVPPAGVSQGSEVKDRCRQFLVWPVRGSNLLVVVMVNRQLGGCKETAKPWEACSSCQPDPRGLQCLRCLEVPPSPPSSSSSSSPAPATTPNLPPALCQCPCSCAVDFSRCRDSFHLDANVTFPMTSCFEEPEQPSVSSQKGTDVSSSSSGVPPCDQLCPSFEKKEDCEAVGHCQWWASNAYPVCRHHPPSTVPQASATTTTATKPESSRSGPSSTFLPHADSSADGEDDKLGGGAIAGIVVGVAVVLAAGFLIGYYWLVKPRLFTRLTETESVAEGERRNSSVYFNSQSDTLDLSVPPLTPSDLCTDPHVTADHRSSHHCC